MRGDGGDEDDRAAAWIEVSGLLLGHHGGGQLGGVVGAEHVDVHAPGDGLGGAIHEGLVGADAGGGYSVDLVILMSEDGLRRQGSRWDKGGLQAVDTPEILYDLVEGGLEACVISHVASAQANPLLSIVYTIS